MSLFRKLVIAGAIVGAGFGVALLLGEPASIKRALAVVESSSQPSSSEAPPADRTATPAWTSSVQLVPETNVAATSGSSAGGATPALTPDFNRQFTTAANDSNLAPPSCELQPRAQLRSEAPRPIGNEPRSPVTIRRAPPLEAGVGASAAPIEKSANPLAAGWAAPTTVPVGYLSAGNPAVATSAIYDAPNESAQRSPVSPPPWPSVVDSEGPRMHVVVDGDSLERLANRYLGDPRRSREIYELNRELLSRPDLLPLGIELKIPDRTVQTSWDRVE